LQFEYVTLSAPPRVQPLRSGTVLTVAEKWLSSACGIISDYQHRGLIIEDNQVGVLLTGGAERFELADPSTGQVVVRPPRAQAVGSGKDLEELARVATAEGWPVSYCARIWRDCELYVEGCAPAIEAVVVKLLTTDYMTSAEVSGVAERAMLNKPAPVIPEWAVRRNLCGSPEGRPRRMVALLWRLRAVALVADNIVPATKTRHLLFLGHVRREATLTGAAG
jgi:hypothetical protein